LLALHQKGIDNQDIQATQKTKLPPQLNEPVKKWATEKNKTFSKEDVQMAKKHMKNCSLSLAIKQMQIKTTLVPSTPVRIAISKNINNNKYW
jgi:hypothetical protein